jgi:hypothetical protein
VSTTRRLAAILPADVAGYSRLIGADEEGTLERLRSIRAEVIDPKIDEYRGRLVKTPGDGLLVEFASVCGRSALRQRSQREMGRRNSDVVEAERIDFPPSGPYTGELDMPQMQKNPERCSGERYPSWISLRLPLYARLKDVTRSRTERINSNSSPFLV